MPRLVYVVTHPMSARFLMRGQLAYMQARGFEVTVVSAPGEDLRAVAEQEGVRVAPVPMAREMRPAEDLWALWRLRRLFEELRPDIVNAGTPKAGLLGMLAARMAGVPVRIYTLRGLRLETTRRLTSVLLHAAERVTAACAHRVLAVSGSLARAYLRRSLAPAHKVTVVGPGSSNGVDARRFASSPQRLQAAQRLRSALGLPEGAPVVGFVGRLTRDKGIVELMESFEQVLARLPEARLLLVGAFEAGDPVPPACRRAIEGHQRVVRAGFASEVAPYYHLMDVLAFPSRREGFPNTPLEAAAAGLPVAGFRATGTVDAVEEGVTGTLLPAGDVPGLARALCRYLEDEALRRAHGAAGRRRAARDFRPERVWKALCREYVRLLEEHERLPEARRVLKEQAEGC